MDSQGGNRGRRLNCKRKGKNNGTIIFGLPWIDAQYTPEKKRGPNAVRGYSSWEEAALTAREAKVSKLYLIHHDSDRVDRHVMAILCCLKVISTHWLPCQAPGNPLFYRPCLANKHLNTRLGEFPHGIGAAIPGYNDLAPLEITNLAA